MVILPGKSSVYSRPCSSHSYSADASTSDSNSSPGATQHNKHPINTLDKKRTHVMQERCKYDATELPLWREMKPGRTYEDILDMGKILANQACHWIDWKISVEIDIKIMGNGFTVCKWQAKHYTMQSAKNSKLPTKWPSLSMLQHSNKRAKGMEITYITWSPRITTWLLLQHTGTCHKQHGKSAKVYPDLVKN